ncbi:MAG: zinc-ribbon domain-containing protein [Thermodesulfobacteriota bacterium]|nr:zinc-ribbon domain-containing protein [Thermodesulfobacteriota bacterium]
MEITCPNCSFTRQVADEKIPSGSVFATCPKCKHRFRFKELEFTIEEPPEPTESAPAEEPVGSAPQESVGSSSEGPAGPMDAEAFLGEAEPQGPTDSPFEDGPAQDEEQAQGAYGFQAEHRFGPGPDVEQPPWEKLDEYGFFSGLTQTVKRAMLHPIRFFDSMPVGVGLGKPLIFYLLLGEFHVACQMLWQLLGLSAMMTMTGRHEAMEMGMTGLGPIALLILYPILLALGLFLSTAVSHVLLLLLRAASAGFEGTFRAMAYSAAPMVLAVVPILGPFTGAVWSMVIMIIALKYIHQTTYTRIGLAFLVPVMVLILAAMVVSFLGFQAPRTMY